MNIIYQFQSSLANGICGWIPALSVSKPTPAQFAGNVCVAAAAVTRSFIGQCGPSDQTGFSFPMVDPSLSTQLIEEAHARARQKKFFLGCVKSALPALNGHWKIQTDF